MNGLNVIINFLLSGAVIPKYGRMVVFRNIIDHSARPPSPDFLAARYTFAVKVIWNLVFFKSKSTRRINGSETLMYSYVALLLIRQKMLLH